MVTPEEVKKLFELARIEASPEELEKFPKEIDAILGYVKILAEAPLADIAPTISFASGKTPLRSDAVITSSQARKIQFPAMQEGYLKTKKVFGDAS